jgi:hypothetical protein
MRIGQRDDLPAVRGIGEDLLVAGHRRVEYDFADRSAGSADRTAMKYRAVGEDERCFLDIRHVDAKSGRGFSLPLH